MCAKIVVYICFAQQIWIYFGQKYNSGQNIMFALAFANYFDLRKQSVIYISSFNLHTYILCKVHIGVVFIILNCTA